MAITSRGEATQRVWFVDPRTPLRRMSVSTHPLEGIAVISLWQGETCSGTFRLPISQAARLVSALAEGMAASLTETGGQGGPKPPGRWAAFRSWTRRARLRPVGGPAEGLRLLK